MRNQQRKESLMILENQNYFKHVFPTELGILFLRLGKLKFNILAKFSGKIV